MRHLMGDPIPIDRHYPPERSERQAIDRQRSTRTRGLDHVS